MTIGELFLLMGGMALLVLGCTLACRKWNMHGTNKLCNRKNMKDQNKSEPEETIEMVEEI